MLLLALFYGQMVNLTLATWQELESVIFLPKFDRYITFEEREEFLLDLSRTFEFVLKTDFMTDICRDSKDNKYLELAVNGQ
jgi:putative PIN family toxin of toxin-antitoxin system